MSRYLATSDFFIGASAGSTNIPSMHYHASYELYYLQVGHRDYFIEDKLFSVSAGDFVLIPPRKLHRTGGEYGERILIGFTAEFLEKVYTKDTCAYLLRCFDDWKRTPSPNQQAGCIDLLTKMLSCKDQIESALLLGMLLMELQTCNPKEIAEDFVSTIVSYINKNYATIDTIDGIADHFFISKYHLCRIFKKAMKTTVIDYLNQIRVKNACQMLTFSQKSVGEISELCGYHSTAYFSSLFKQITGRTPSEYRKDTLHSKPGENSNIL